MVVVNFIKIVANHCCYSMNFLFQFDLKKLQLKCSSNQERGGATPVVSDTMPLAYM